MTEQSTKIIEINGVKFEVDSRTVTLKEISKIQIGSRVKVLIETYGSQFDVKHGVVIGFEPFATKPTVIICYMNSGYSSSAPELKFLYFNESSKEQIIISHEDDKEAIIQSNIVGSIDKAIVKLESEIQDLHDRKAYFLRNFQSYWQPMEMQNPTAE